jgi:hypothetical protein
MYNYSMANPQAPLLPGIPDTERFFKLGMICSIGQAVPLDMVLTHKWFNVAGALRDEGCRSPA